MSRQYIESLDIETLDIETLGIETLDIETTKRTFYIKGI